MSPILIQCLDGSYLNVGSVYRWFITEDIIGVHNSAWEIKASAVGPQNPFKVARFDDEDKAKAELLHMLQSVATVLIPDLPDDDG